MSAEVLNPATGAVLTTVPSPDEAAVDQAVANAGHRRSPR